MRFSRRRSLGAMVKGWLAGMQAKFRRPKIQWRSRRPALRMSQFGRQELRRRTSFQMAKTRLRRIRVPFSKKWLKWLLIPAAIGLLYFLFGSGFFNLAKLEITGNHLTTPEQIQTVMFPKGFRRVNALTFPDSRYVKRVMSIAQISEVSFSKKILKKTLVVEVKEHQTSIIWQTGGERFFVNRFGVVYDRADDSSPLMVVEDLKNVPVSVSQKIVSPDFLEFVTSFVANLPRKTNISIRRIIVPETTFEVEMITENGWRIILDTTKSYDDQLNNLVKVLRESEDQQPKEYVDLRIGDKVFWK